MLYFIIFNCFVTISCLMFSNLAGKKHYGVLIRYVDFEDVNKKFLQACFLTVIPFINVICLLCIVLMFMVSDEQLEDILTKNLE